MSKMVCLNGSNYHIWKGKMKDLLFVKKMHLPVFASNKPQSLNDEEWEFEHLQVCGYIRQWVEDNVRNHIVNETHAKVCGTSSRHFMLRRLATTSCSY